MVLQQWGSVLWTDDSRNLVDEWQLPGEWYLSDCIVPYVKFYGREIMVWGCLSGVGLSPIMPVKETPWCGNGPLFYQDCTTNSVQSKVHQGMGDTFMSKAILYLATLVCPHWPCSRQQNMVAPLEPCRPSWLWCVCKASRLLMEQLQISFSGHSSESAVYICHIMQLQQALPQVGKYSSSSCSRGEACLLWKEQMSYFLCPLNALVCQWIFLDDMLWLLG